MKALNVLLVGNYQPDRQESMQRFAEVLQRALEAQGQQVRLLRPAPVFNRAGAPGQGKAKWLGYLDKFVVFPWVLRRAARRADIVHIVDHSNAPYTRVLQRTPHLVTCNDVLAIRSAMGHFPQNPTGWSGKLLQKIILRGLNRARHVACISHNTRSELLQVSSLPEQCVTTIYMGQNYPYSPMLPVQAQERVAALLPREAQKKQENGSALPSFILHVGANHWYKNRMGVLRIYRHMCQLMGMDKAPLLLMVGEPLSDEMQHYIAEHALQTKVVSINNAANEDLRALYSCAELLLFPSLAEGFGWPIAEAQACGCRVVTTGRAPMTEVGGDAALYVAPENESAAAECVINALAASKTAKQERIDAGLQQAAAFSTAPMVEAYGHLYATLLHKTAT